MTRRRISSAPWAKFKVGTRSSSANWTEPSCQPLLTVAHVAHVPTAVRVVEDRRLRADLIFDKSKLNTERIRVVWLSPNDWSGAGGFRYGNVRFNIDWAALMKDRRLFWVESVAYGIDACRILLTDKDHAPLLPPYDPTAGDGPLWCALDGTYHWNGNHCLEIMFEGDIPLGAVQAIDFVKHHPKRCNIDYKGCPYLDRSADRGGADFLSILASLQRLSDLPGLVEDDGAATWALHGAASAIRGRCRRLAPRLWGKTRADDGPASAIARALLGALGNPRLADDRTELAALFRSADDLHAAVAAVLATGLGLANPAALFEYDG